MWHVYRQINGLHFNHRVITRNRSNEERFPYRHVRRVRKSPWRILHRWTRTSNHPAAALPASEQRHVLRMLQDEQVELLHVYLGSEALRLPMVLRCFSGARIVSFHGADLSHNYHAEQYAPLWPEATLVLCRCRALANRLQELGCPQHKIRIHYTGVPVPEESSEPSCDPLHVLQVCRLIEKKGLDVTLRTMAKLIHHHQIHAVLDVAGEGPMKEKLIALADTLGISKHVRFHGFVSGLALEALFRKASFFMHPSRITSEGDREGIPNSLLEAMAYGIPVIATPHSGIPEAVQHSINGWLIPGEDADAAAECIVGALNDKPGLDRIRNEARHTIQNQFSITRCVEALETFYKEALQLRHADSTLSTVRPSMESPL